MIRDAAGMRNEGIKEGAGGCVSRGEVGFNPTAVFARGSLSEGEGLGWSLALAIRGEVRVYGPVREGGGLAGR